MTIRPDRLDPQAPFEVLRRASTDRLFPDYFDVIGIGGISGTRTLDYVLTREEAEQLRDALTAALAADTEPRP